MGQSSILPAQRGRPIANRLPVGVSAHLATRRRNSALLSKEAGAGPSMRGIGPEMVRPKLHATTVFNTGCLRRRFLSTATKVKVVCLA
jgi:hypothetical protein